MIIEMDIDQITRDEIRNRSIVVEMPKSYDYKKIVREYEKIEVEDDYED